MGLNGGSVLSTEYPEAHNPHFGLSPPLSLTGEGFGSLSGQGFAPSAITPKPTGSMDQSFAPVVRHVV
jgi:hypothetical protein